MIRYHSPSQAFDPFQIAQPSSIVEVIAKFFHFGIHINNKIANNMRYARLEETRPYLVIGLPFAWTTTHSFPGKGHRMGGAAVGWKPRRAHPSLRTCRH